MKLQILLIWHCLLWLQWRKNIHVFTHRADAIEPNPKNEAFRHCCKHKDKTYDKDIQRQLRYKYCASHVSEYFSK